MAFDFKEAIKFMEEFGIYDVVLPFILIFTIIFATLEKIKIFGQEGRRYNALIALSIALLFVAATNLVEAVNHYLPIIGLVLAIFLGLMLLLGIFGVEEGSKGVKTMGWILAGIVSITIGLAYLPQITWFKEFFDSLESYSGVLIVIVILIAIIVWVVKGEKKPVNKSS